MPRRQESPRGRGWIGGFGIVPSHRGRGLATGLLREQLDVATASGIRRVQLEVLTQNWAARSYERAGFVTTRRLSVLQGTIGATIAAAADPPGAKWLDAVDVPHLAGELDRLHADYPAAWTREPETLDLEHGKVRCLAIGPLDQPTGILLSKERAGVVHVVDAAALDEKAAGWVVSALAQEHAGLQSRLVNEPDGSPLVGAFTAAGVREVMAQYEMHWHR